MFPSFPLANRRRMAYLPLDKLSKFFKDTQISKIKDQAAWQRNSNWTGACCENPLATTQFQQWRIRKSKKKISRNEIAQMWLCLPHSRKSNSVRHGKPSFIKHCQWNKEKWTNCRKKPSATHMSTNHTGRNQFRGNSMALWWWVSFRKMKQKHFCQPTWVGEYRK